MRARALACRCLPRHAAAPKDGQERLLLFGKAKQGDEKPSVFALDVRATMSRQPKELQPDVAGLELSSDGSHMLLRLCGGGGTEGDCAFRLCSTAASTCAAPDDDASSERREVRMGEVSVGVDTATEWRAMFRDAWRMLRDLFYDPSMHGADWQSALQQLLPLTARIADRRELNELLAQLIARVCALHTWVGNGDGARRALHAAEHAAPGNLGAALRLDAARRGLVVTHIYQADPHGDTHSPLARCVIQPQNKPFFRLPLCAGRAPSTPRANPGPLCRCG